MMFAAGLCPTRWRWALAGVVLGMGNGSVAFGDLRQVALGLGVEQLQLREDLIRPFRWSGPSVGPRFGFGSVGARVEQDGELGLAFAFLTNRFGQESYAFTLQAHYAVLYRVSERVAIGGVVRANWLPAYHADWDDAHLYWFTSYDIGPMVRGRWRGVGPGDVAVTVALPVAALVSRPPRHRMNKQDELKSLSYWFTQPHENMQAAVLGRYVAVAAEAAYFFAGASAWRWGAAYRFDLRRYVAPEPIAVLRHGLTVEVARAW